MKSGSYFRPVPYDRYCVSPRATRSERWVEIGAGRISSAISLVVPRLDKFLEYREILASAVATGEIGLSSSKETPSWSRQKALVTPAVMRWARESARLSPEDASKRIGLPVDELEAWENGEKHPTIAQARKASRLTGVLLLPFICLNRRGSESLNPRY